MYRNKFIYVQGAETWLRFDPSAGWVATRCGEPDAAAKHVLEALKADRVRQAASGADEARIKQLGRHIEYTSRAPHLRAMLTMAQSEPQMSAALSDFDADPMMLGVSNGIIDLHKGSLLSVTPALLVTKRCNVPFDPAAACPSFDAFLQQVQPDPDMRRFLQRLCGYLLTGSVAEQCFAFLHGGGGNGKSVFVELFYWLLGDYAHKISTELLMEHKRNPQGPSPDIVQLKGVRLAFASETEERHRLAAARVKELTGGDTLSGRLPYAKSSISFTPSHKLLVVGNYRPEISDTSAGMWRRILLVGFEQTIPAGQRDRHLIDRLKVEGSGILNWALAGLRDWIKHGLQVPAAISTATNAYRDEQDVIGAWLDESFSRVASARVGKELLYQNHKWWAEANGHHPLSKTRLTRQLNDRGIKVDAGRRHFQGLAVKPRPPSTGIT